MQSKLQGFRLFSYCQKKFSYTCYQHNQNKCCKMQPDGTINVLNRHFCDVDYFSVRSVVLYGLMFRNCKSIEYIHGNLYLCYVEAIWCGVVQSKDLRGFYSLSAKHAILVRKGCFVASLLAVWPGCDLCYDLMMYYNYKVLFSLVSAVINSHFLTDIKEYALEGPCWHEYVKIIIDT